MDKKEFPKENLASKDIAPEVGENSLISGVKEKFSALSNWLFGVTKLILGICLLPFVYSATVAFLNQFSLVDKTSQDYFWYGVICLIVIHLLVWEPAKIYSFGHKILELVFNFFKPLVKVAPYLLPIYTITLFVLYIILAVFNKSSELLTVFIFLFGFSISLHLVFSAKTLRSKKGDFLKGNYIFGFSFVYIINVSILAFFLNVIFEKFSFVNYSNQAYQAAGYIFKVIFKQLFL